MTAEITYRPGTYEDIYELSLIMGRANDERDRQPVLPTRGHILDQAFLEERMDRTSSWTRVAMESGRIAGFALTHPLLEEGETTTDTEHLSLLMIDPAHWSKGIASSLLGQIVDRAQHNKRAHVTLWTRQADNERARGLYERKLFVPTGITRGRGFETQLHYSRPIN